MLAFFGHRAGYQGSHEIVLQARSLRTTRLAVPYLPPLPRRSREVVLRIEVFVLVVVGLGLGLGLGEGEGYPYRPTPIAPLQAEGVADASGAVAAPTAHILLRLDPDLWNPNPNPNPL